MSVSMEIGHSQYRDVEGGKALTVRLSNEDRTWIITALVPEQSEIITVHSFVFQYFL